MAFPRERSAHELEAQVDEVGIQHIGLTITTDAHAVAGEILIPNLGAREAKLAWKSQECGNIGKRGARPRLKARQHVHEIKVSPVIAAQVIVVAKRGVRSADFPIARSLNASCERAIVQHRQIKARTVP